MDNTSHTKILELQDADADVCRRSQKSFIQLRLLAVCKAASIMMLIANPNQAPKAIFISAYASAPLAADL